MYYHKQKIYYFIVNDALITQFSFKMQSLVSAIILSSMVKDELVSCFFFIGRDPGVGACLRMRAFFPVAPALSLCCFLQRCCLPEVLDPIPDKFQVKPSFPCQRHRPRSKK